MVIKQNLLPIGEKGSNRILTPKGVTIHDTGNYARGTGAWWHSEYLKKSTREASWHYAVDDKEAVQSITDDRVAWHAGRGNATTLSIEICVNADSNLVIATENAAKLAAILIHRHNMELQRIYQHHDWQQKDCPHELRSGNPYSWEAFVQQVYYYYSLLAQGKADEKTI